MMMMMIDVTSGIGMEGSEEVYNRVYLLFYYFIIFYYLSLYLCICNYVLLFGICIRRLALEHVSFCGR